MIERAKTEDIDDIERLLYQVHKVHSDSRPDLFKVGLKKYSRDEIVKIMCDDSTPIYVYKQNGKLLGYAFVVYLKPSSNSLVDIKTMYIDDFCVDECARHMKIGTKIFADLEIIAKQNNCYNILLNVYNFNVNAVKFYESLGMTKLKTYMEKIVK